ncbi:MAG: hypothetical protein NVS4B11_24310 [Ktedonobacteraceae bacterium]
MDASLNGPFGRNTLSSDVLTIGRLPDNKLVISDLKASSRHAEIRPAGNGYTITDLGSTNGTFVNEQQLRPNEPYQLNTGDVVRVGDTRFTYEASGTPQMDPTIYAERGAASGYNPTIAVPPPAPLANTVYGVEQQNYQPYAQSPPPPPYGQPVSAYPPAPSYGQPQAAPPYGYPPAVQPKKSNRTLFIILGSVLGGVILLCVLISIVVNATRSTPEKTLTAYCNALKGGDYQTAYNQFSHSIQSQESEAQFTSAFTSTRLSVTGCSVSNTSDDGTIGMGTMSYTTNANIGGINDYRLIQENGEWKISSQTPRK